MCIADGLSLRAARSDFYTYAHTERAGVRAGSSRCVRPRCATGCTRTCGAAGPRGCTRLRCTWSSSTPRALATSSILRVGESARIRFCMRALLTSRGPFRPSDMQMRHWGDACRSCTRFALRLSQLVNTREMRRTPCVRYCGTRVFIFYANLWAQVCVLLFFPQGPKYYGLW